MAYSGGRYPIAALDEPKAVMGAAALYQGHPVKKQNSMSPKDNGMSDSNMIKMGAFWLSESKSGEKYFSGYLNGAKLMIFKNKHKTEEKHPDYIMYLAPNPKENGGGGGNREPALEDDIPF